MELKRILARDSRSANEKAIQLYGKDVLIISSQRLDNQTELIVAVDLAEQKPQPAAQVSAAQAPAAEEAPQAFVPFSKLFQSASSFAPLPSDEPMAEPARAAEPILAASAAVVKAQAPAAPDTGLSQAAAAQERSTSAEAQQLRHENQRNQEIVELLRQEMAALRKEFTLSRQMMPWQDGLRLSPAIQQLSLAMSEVGMPAGLRALLTDSIQAFDSVEQAWPVMQGLLVNALNRPSMAVPQAGVHALCGPSGSGKTLMVGRLAYAAAQVHGVESQVMVSFADQRPGAWAQMQMLAAQSGVACFRANNSEMLRTLLADLEGKTVWIDTCGTDFAAQAKLLLSQHPQVLRHAVLPVDATVTSVQKILQNSDLNWSSLMLSKVDEAAYPWALVKGLSEQSLGVSCVAGSSRIDQAAEPFDAERLVHLALAPLLQHLPQDASAVPNVASAVAAPTLRASADQAQRLDQAADAAPNVQASAAKAALPLLTDDIEIPTLLGAMALSPSRKKAANTSSALKVAHG